MTSSCSSWVPLVSFSKKNVDDDENSEITKLVYVKRTDARIQTAEDCASHKGETKTGDSSVGDKIIVWPPIVILENTRLGWDNDKRKWNGLGHEDIRRFVRKLSDQKSTFVKVKCLFDVKGQKGCALVIFAKSNEGYLEAKALDRLLSKMSKGRMDWARVKPLLKSHKNHMNTVAEWSTDDLVSPRGERILYGYLATPEDMERLDRHRRSIKWFAESFHEKLAFAPSFQRQHKFMKLP
ncbi:hypothetical protein MPTK1_3g16610 [Marchantia polymorpha subsp. ruderalis]|uniref:XS domain-containing protein n=2 Tax=Marchantia polymorpha TaxID=3197 RepID=A0AAF6B1J1_MARPO|nr:hypothetical protein MARPO_0004s0010 [Marchantia polymorpha]PTQ48701.1 hypothetical protein MARPO_0004s0010 [Marchantia polymorpha]BBN05875.1 hypothetical protein Mp_3g16610 [Marchantia polymorpha subsp. ruderalis]BBN05876.1 hypothetical protein Mp_3g16610 [Marchantia polymorpha subsp. ruderalis]|eukprot:PTQ48700.1 hypothetical protein MARPO_0004s0010 [Marchantia polymorpha]